jgi:hypothetical protein
MPALLAPARKAALRARRTLLQCMHFGSKEESRGLPAVRTRERVLARRGTRNRSLARTRGMHGVHVQEQLHVGLLDVLYGCWGWPTGVSEITARERG